jgi:glyoxylase-like metal-dependent hydrolase (beta-lactamase superfamily II)
VVFRTREGLVVVDNGRHTEHSDAILAFARAEGRPIAAILNTHWHLDHSSGNRRLKAVFPEAPVYATSAIDGALTGFLANALTRDRARFSSGAMGEAEAAEAHIFFETMAHSDGLRPDIVVARSARTRIAGKRFDLHVTDHAVTGADLWLYDRRSRIAVLGDLVTLPAPFFETACVERWRDALNEVWATPFRIAVPGHGEPMTRAQFALYRTAYGVFIDCVQSDAAADACAAAWSEEAAPLMVDERLRRVAPDYAEYYVGMLREHGGNSAECAKP